MKIERSIYPLWLIAALMLVATGSGCGDRVAPSRPDAGVSDMGTDSDVDLVDMSDAKSQIGESCNGPADCVDGASCIGTFDGSFVCMAFCETPYSLCDDASVCTPVSDGASAVCYIGGDAGATDPCTSNLACAPGLLCFGSEPDFYCRTACEAATGEGCLPGEFCLELATGAGVCRDLIGSSCEVDSDCSAGLGCTAAIDDAWAAAYPGGYCTSACSTDEDCSFGSRCASIPDSQTQVCIKSCEHVSDCRFNTSYRCVERTDCEDEPDVELCEALTVAGSACLR